MASIEVAMRAMSYQTSGERPRCGNCRNHEVREGDRAFGRDSFRCKLGGFMVSPYAICAKYETERRREPQGEQA